MTTAVSEEIIESAIINYVSDNPAVSVTEVISELSNAYQPSKVRNVYWKLLSESKMRRSPDGRLTLT